MVSSLPDSKDSRMMDCSSVTCDRSRWAPSSPMQSKAKCLTTEGGQGSRVRFRVRVRVSIRSKVKDVARLRGDR